MGTVKKKQNSHLRAKVVGLVKLLFSQILAGLFSQLLFCNVEMNRRIDQYEVTHWNDNVLPSLHGYA